MCKWAYWLAVGMVNEKNNVNCCSCNLWGAEQCVLTLMIGTIDGSLISLRWLPGKQIASNFSWNGEVSFSQDIRISSPFYSLLFVSIKINGVCWCTFLFKLPENFMSKSFCIHYYFVIIIFIGNFFWGGSANHASLSCKNLSILLWKILYGWLIWVLGIVLESSMLATAV